MDTALGQRLKQFLMRAVFYAAGFILIIFLLIAIIFTLAKPRLLAMAEREMQKYGIHARDVDMSLFGNLHIHNLDVPLHDGGALRIDEISARPPLHFFGTTWLGGSGALYNLRLEKGGMTAFIPELDFSGASLEDKDSAIASRSLQMLKRLRASSISADKIELAFSPENGGGTAPARLRTAISGFSIRGLNDGKIAEIGYSGMDSNAALPVSGSAQGAAGENGGAEPESKKSNLHSGAFAAEKVDAASLYALARSLSPQTGKNAGKEPKIAFPAGARDLVGQIHLRDVDMLARDEKLGTVHIALDRLDSDGFALKGNKNLGDFIMRQPAPAKGQSEADAKKQIIIHNIRQMLADIASVDINGQNIIVDVQPTPEIIAAAKAAQKADADRLAKAEKAAKLAADKKAAAKSAAVPDGQKSVNDILNEDQAQADEDESSSANPGNDESADADADAAETTPLAVLEEQNLKHDLTHLPPQFKLTLSSFALSANHWEQAIPHNFYIRVKDMVYVPGNDGNQFLSALQAIGRENLQFSLIGDVAWNPADSSLNVSQFAFKSSNMGGFSFTGKFLDIPQSIFDGKPEAVQQVLDNAGIADMKLLLDNDGFLEKLVQWGTTQINITAQELQTDLHDIAVKSPPLLFKNRSEAQNFSDVFGNFVNNPGAILIKMNAPEKGGLKLHDIMNSQEDLSTVLDKLHMNAEKTDQAIEIK